MKLFIAALVSFTLFVCMVGMAARPLQEAGVSPAITYSVAVGLTFVLVLFAKRPSDVHTADLQMENWVRYIIQRLRKDNTFLNCCFKDDDNVLAGKVVHIPQPGTKPNVVKNRTSLPAAAVQRADTELTYPLDEYTTDPTYITNAESVELSFAKMDDVLGDHVATLGEVLGDDVLIKWAGGTSTTIATSGALAAATESGQTGNRKVMVRADFRRLMGIFNKQKVPKTDRYCALESNMLDQLVEDMSSTQQRDFTSAVDPKTGVIGELYGFKVLERSNIVMVTSADAVKALGAAVGATDNVMSLAWHKNSVASAIGEIVMFDDKGNPVYYGDLVSALVRAGARVRRADGSGIVGIIGKA